MDDLFTHHVKCARHAMKKVNKEGAFMKAWITSHMKHMEFAKIIVNLD